ncbi:alpha/beta hydrolase family esterase [Neptuniibacter sp. QD34_54]|uniref:alpha/beta hydrolase family esterase n=1 Tax=Neptuniibacter sp. QD34_54 TaxID=3398208 RepID=UPI0039F59B49
MRITRFLLAVSMAFTCMVSLTANAKGSTTEHSLKVGADYRTYRVYSPNSDGTNPFPVMILLHGGLGNAKYMQSNIAIEGVADEGQFKVVFADGTGGRVFTNNKTWNAGKCCGYSVEKKINDVQFISTLIDELVETQNIDASKVYVGGMSNGAMMAYRAVCQLPEKITAMFSVAGTLAIDNCDRAVKVPVLHIHGENDENVPVDGGTGSNSISGVEHRSVADTISLVSSKRDCLQPETEMFDEVLELNTYRCAKGADVRLLIIKNGEHVWPGSKRDEQADVHGFNASEQSWLFVKQFMKSS